MILFYGVGVGDGELSWGFFGLVGGFLVEGGRGVYD